MLRASKRAAAERVAASAAGGEGGAAAATPAEARPWHAALSVRVILVLLAMFLAVHMVLWRVLWSFIAEMNHGRLHDATMLAWTNLKQVIDHL